MEKTIDTCKGIFTYLQSFSLKSWGYFLGLHLSDPKLQGGLQGGCFTTSKEINYAASETQNETQIQSHLPKWSYDARFCGIRVGHDPLSWTTQKIRPRKRPIISEKGLWFEFPSVCHVPLITSLKRFFQKKHHLQILLSDLYSTTFSPFFVGHETFLHSPHCPQCAGTKTPSCGSTLSCHHQGNPPKSSHDGDLGQKKWRTFIV